MRIGYVTPRYYPDLGGVERHVGAIASQAARAGHDVEVLTQARDSGLPAVELDGDVVIRRFAVAVPSEPYALAPTLWSYLRYNQDAHDVLHAHNYHALPALAAAMASPKPLVFTPHYHGTSDSAVRRVLHRPYRLAGRRIFDRSARVICVSMAERDVLCADFPAVGRRVSVIPNGVDVDRIGEPTPLMSMGGWCSPGADSRATRTSIWC